MRFRNTSSRERGIRIGLGFLILALGWQQALGNWAFLFRVVALYPLITGVVGWCPIYALLRVDTNRH